MKKKLTLLMAQINPIVGAIEANTQQIIDIVLNNQTAHDIILFPELTLTGYPTEDLLLRSELFTRVECALDAIKRVVSNCHVIIGYPMREDNRIYNVAGIFYDGSLIDVYRKQHLPNYGVFDEKRYFTPGPSIPCVINVNDYVVGLCICEDIWQPGPVEQLAELGVELLLCMNASPFDDEKYPRREHLLCSHAQRGLIVVYVNQVGGQDELVFDGQSMVLDNQGRVCARAPAFETDLQTISLSNQTVQGDITPLLNDDALIYQALVCGLRDYVNKNHFPSVLLGLSGGIDSALTLAIAVDALGPSRVHVLMLPSRFTADMSLDDASQQAQFLNSEYASLSIEPIFESCLATLSVLFSTEKPDLMQENLQARIRGVLLMAVSNKQGHLLLTTGNKSEMAVGYSTLYGDMNGGFSVLKDVLKTRVYALARYRNSIHSVIPMRVIERPPSAELAENQTDQDSLPDYTILDGIICAYMNEGLSVSEIVARGYGTDDVVKTVNLIKRNEYKRRQAAPGVKITTCAFGRDWRYPMTSKF